MLASEVFFKDNVRFYLTVKGNTAMKQYDVYGIGNALVDTVINTDDECLNACNLQKGLMELVDLDRQNEIIGLLGGNFLSAQKASGGSAANTVIAVSQLGGSSFYSCKVAADEMGEFYLNDLKDAGVDADPHLENSDQITGKCLVMVTPDAERTMNTYLGISESLSMKNINFDALTQSKWLYLEGYLVTSDSAKKAAIACKDAAEKSGVKTAITLSDPGMVEFFKEGLLEMIGSGVDLLFCNIEEAKQWTGKETAESALKELTSISKNVIITRHSEGALVFDGHETIEIKAVETNAIDSNGAGDAFAGAFLYAINNGFDYQTAGNIAALAASKVVSQYGPRLEKAQYAAISSQFQSLQRTTG